MTTDPVAEPPQGAPQSTQGSADSSAEPRFLVVGRIIRPHGVRGEVRVELHTDDARRFKQLAAVHIGDPSTEPTEIRSAREHQGVALVSFKGFEDRDAVEGLRNQWLYIPIEDATPLAEGEYFLYQLEGLTVSDSDGRSLGKLVEVMETGANNVFVVRGPRGDFLLPDIPDVVSEIDFENSRMVVRLLPGLVDPALLPPEGDDLSPG